MSYISSSLVFVIGVHHYGSYGACDVFDVSSLWVHINGGLFPC